MTLSPVARAAALVAAILAAPAAFAAPAYHLTDLGPNTYGAAINDAGDVALGVGIDDYVAAVWRHGDPTYTLLARGNVVSGINSRGAVAGSNQGSGAAWGVRWSSTGAVTKIKPPGSIESIATAIGDDGTTYGWFNIDTTYAYHPYAWRDGVTTDLGCPSVFGCIPVAVNRNGMLVGHIYTSQSSWHIGVYQAGQWTDLGTLGGESGEANAVNRYGHVVGDSAYRTKFVTPHAFIWKGDALRDLKTMGGNYSIAYGIDADDTVVGATSDAAGAVFAAMWIQGTWYRLSDLTDNAAGYDFAVAQGITADGRILVNTYVGNEAHAVVLVPVPGTR